MPKEAAIALRRAFGQLSPGSFDRSVDLFGPAKVAEPCSWLRFHVPRGLAGENEVITFGFREGWLVELERSQEDRGHERQKAARAPLVEEVVLRDMYEIAVNRAVDGEAL